MLRLRLALKLLARDTPAGVSLCGSTKRREFLKTAAAGAAGVVVLPSLAGLARADDEHGDRETQFSFAVATRAGETADAIILDGGGSFGDGGIEGESGFTHFRLAATKPFPIVQFGRWKATKLVAFNQAGATYGSHKGVILDLLVELRAASGLVVKGAKMRVVCNLGPAGVETGLEEGVRLRSQPRRVHTTSKNPSLGRPCSGTKGED